jgi:hypothetical protein
MNYDQFVSKLKSLVRRTTPDPVGHWTRYLENEDPALVDFVVSLCRSYVNGDEAARRKIEECVKDDDVLWLIQRFIEDQCELIQNRSDVEALLLGLAAVAIIGYCSDPRDVNLWVEGLYSAAVAASVPERAKICERVGGLAAVGSISTEIISLFAVRHEKTIQKQVAMLRSRKFGSSGEDYKG